jgi:5-methylcytosine-specific restriction protein A
MQRALKICRSPGCTNLTYSAYCKRHIRVPNDRRRESWDKLNARKTIESKRFYSSAEWTKCSVRHKAIEPLCRRCKAKGIVKVVEITHHNPPLEILISQGENPFAEKNLESLCFNCHQEELRKKSYDPINKTRYY